MCNRNHIPSFGYSFRLPTYRLKVLRRMILLGCVEVTMVVVKHNNSGSDPAKVFCQLVGVQRIYQQCHGYMLLVILWSIMVISFLDCPAGEWPFLPKWPSCSLRIKGLIYVYSMMMGLYRIFILLSTCVLQESWLCQSSGHS